MSNDIPVVDLHDPLIETARKLDLIKPPTRKSSGVRYCLRCQESRISGNKIYCMWCEAHVDNMIFDQNRKVDADVSSNKS